MSLLEVNGLKFKYRDIELYNDASFRLFEREHVGLVGANGVGKSTFIHLITKELSPDYGSIEWMPKLKIGYLDQHLKVNSNLTVKEYLYDVFSELFLKEAKMEELYASLMEVDESKYDRILNHATSIQEELEEKNFYAFKSKIGNVLSGLGIDESRINDELKILSGGQRAKVMLAKLLLEEPDVLIMDEPTNFLDVSHVEWLKKYLINYPNAFIVVSHDEDFLAEIVNVVACLENKKITKYKGDYYHFLEEREIQNNNYKAQYEKQQAFIKKTQEFIDKNITRATTSKRAQSRQKMLEKIDVMDKPASKKKIHIEFPFTKELGVEPLVVRDLVVGYNKPILPKINFKVGKNEKIAITGHNGIGKTTILKTLIKEIESLSGSFRFMDNVIINYFKQEEVYKDETPYSIILDSYPLYEDKKIRQILASVGIDKTMVLKKMIELSGGEQTKVRLALLMQKKCNFLIFDEPTNHLDIDAKEALFEAIKTFPGCVLLVSHETEFYKPIVDKEIDIEKI